MLQNMELILSLAYYSRKLLRLVKRILETRGSDAIVKRLIKKKKKKKMLYSLSNSQIAVQIKRLINLQSLNVLANSYRAHNCRILKGVRGALQEELSDFLEIRGTWFIYTRRSQRSQPSTGMLYTTNCDNQLILSKP